MNTKRPALLVVDDAAVNLDILLETLGEDYTVRVATDGTAALDSVKRNLPDLILLDVMMPGMDGFEVCRQLKADPVTKAVPVIFLTALDSDSDEARGLGLGGVDYIAKPFNPAIVRTRVRNHLELKRYREHLESLVAERSRELKRANERALELSRLRDDFLGMISHEIRTPINGLLGMGELLIDLCPASEEREQYSRHFRSSSSRLFNLLEDAVMIAEAEHLSTERGAAISFLALLAQVRASLADVQISVLRPTALGSVLLRGECLLYKRALLVAPAFRGCY